MNLSDLTTTQIIIIIALAVAVIFAALAIVMSIRKRRTEKLRNQFGSAEYTRAVKEGGSQRKAEAALNERADRVEKLHIRPPQPGARTRFLASWTTGQARFGDGPGS